MFGNTSFKKRLIISFLIVIVLSQTILSYISYFQLHRMNNFSDKTLGDLGNYCLEKGKESLQEQSITYLGRLGKEAANSSGSMFQEIENRVQEMTLSMEQLYSSYSISHEKVFPPDMNSGFESREAVDFRGYVIDESSEDSVLVYDNGFTGKVYKTDMNQWKQLTQEERNTIDENNTVVSNHMVPNNLLEQINHLSGFTNILKPVYTYNLALDSIYFGTESGIFGIYSMYEIKRFFDPRKREWYTQAVNRWKNGDNSAVWQPAYVSVTNGRICITCSKVFTDSNGGLNGVLAIDMYLDNVADKVLNSKIGESGYAFVIDNEANLVIDQSYKSLIDVTPRNILDSKISDSYRSIIMNMKNLQTGVEMAEIGGKDYYISFAPITSQKWSLGVVADISEIIRPIEELSEKINSQTNNSAMYMSNMMSRSLIQFLFIICVSSVFTIIISIAISRKISRPILELTKSVSNIGDIGLLSPIQINSNDEIGKLSEAFNKMSDKIKEYIDRLTFIISEKYKIRAELNIAKGIQAGMLPSIFPAFPSRDDFDIYATMEPAKEVGGDFYDFFFIDKKNLAMMIADVSGKGVAAALFMVISKTLLKNEAQSGVPINEVLNNVNKKLCENNDQGMFVTVFISVFNIQTGKLTYSNAGHNHPLIYRKRDDKFDWLKIKRGFVLAGLENIKYEIDSTYLDEGDTLYLYTDGVTEALNRENKLFSDKRLIDLLNSIKSTNFTLKEILGYVRKEITLFADGAEQADDITMLIFRNNKIDIDDDKY